MSPALVTVVIPVFNGEAHLDAAIRSALGQSYQPLEVIVCDDGSTDRSAAIAAGHEVRLLKLPHRGVSAALNAGIAAARGELIAFHDADDLWPPERLVIQTRHLLERAQLGFVVAHAVQFLEPGATRPSWLTDEWMRAVHSAASPRRRSQHRGVTAPVPHARTLLARREIFDLVGGFDETKDMGEDLDWLMRARDAGVRYELLPDVVLHQRLHSTNVSYRLADSSAARLRVARESVARKRRACEPSVSVIVPVLDGERFLREAIHSAQAQTHRPLEIIVVDDGSSDRSAAIAEDAGARVPRRPHRGVSAARNAGIAVAGGDLIALLDADDRWPPDRLAVQVAALRRRPELGLVIGRARLFLDPGTPRPDWISEELTEGVTTLALGTILARRDLFTSIGGFDEGRDVCEDLDWLARARDAGIAHEVLDDVVLEYRIHGANTGLPRRHELEQGVLGTLRSSLARKRALAPS